MSAALPLPVGFAAAHAHNAWPSAADQKDKKAPGRIDVSALATSRESEASPHVSVAFYRRHTENLLRRYLYASMQVGRTPSILRDSVGRGWCSSRPVRTFEDAVIFVLDMEACLDRLQELDRQLLQRVVLQDYTQAETAALLGMSVRTVCYRLPQALDRLTERLLDAGLLVVPG